MPNSHRHINIPIKLEIKKIRGHRYLYFRENLKVNAKSPPMACNVGKPDNIDNTAFATKFAESTYSKVTKFGDFQDPQIRQTQSDQLFDKSVMLCL